MFFSFSSPLLFYKTCRTPDRYEAISSPFQMWLKGVNGLQKHWGCQETLGSGSSPDIIPRLACSLSNWHYCWCKVLSWHHLRCILLGHRAGYALTFSWRPIIYVPNNSVGFHSYQQGWHRMTHLLAQIHFFPLPNTELKLCAVLKLLSWF